MSELRYVLLDRESTDAPWRLRRYDDEQREVIRFKTQKIAVGQANAGQLKRGLQQVLREDQVPRDLWRDTVVAENHDVRGEWWLEPVCRKLCAARRRIDDVSHPAVDAAWEAYINDARVVVGTFRELLLAKHKENA